MQARWSWRHKCVPCLQSNRLASNGLQNCLASMHSTKPLIQRRNDACEPAQRRIGCCEIALWEVLAFSTGKCDAGRRSRRPGSARVGTLGGCMITRVGSRSRSCTCCSPQMSGPTHNWRCNKPGQVLNGYTPSTHVGATAAKLAA